MTASQRKKHSDVKPEFIISVLPQPALKKMSEVQQVQLDIIERTNFNALNGKKIAELLKQNHHMWRSVLMLLDLISLRDMAEGNGWHADTLYIYPETGYQWQLEKLVREQFDASEIEWINGPEAEDILGTSEVADESHVILFVWWD